MNTNTRRILTVLLVFVLLLTVLPNQAQRKKKKKEKIPRAEKKALKEEIRAFYSNEAGLLAFKELLNSEAQNNAMADELEAKLPADRAKIDEATSTLEDMKKEEEELRAEIARLKNNPNEGGSSGNNTPQTYQICNLTSGTVYKIQVIMSDAEWNTAGGDIKFTGETDADGTKKYTFACFSDKNQAEEFNKKLLSINMNTKIEVYKDGNKVQ